jgi:hypothetical protein
MSKRLHSQTFRDTSPRDILFLCVAEAPNLIALGVLAGQIAEGFVLECQARLAYMLRIVTFDTLAIRAVALIELPSTRAEMICGRFSIGRRFIMSTLYVSGHVYVKRKMLDIPDRSRIIET